MAEPIHRDRAAPVGGSDDSKKLYLVDGTSNLFRAFYAIRNLTSPRGSPTNATYGFTQMIWKLLHDEKPDYVAVVFDRPEPTHRHEAFAAYKAHRPAPPEDLVLQIPDVKRVCQVLGVPIVELAGYEADDLIGTLSRKAADDGFRVVIVASDKDLLQLVNESTLVLHPVKGALLDKEGVRRTFGVSPEQVVEVLALMGDASDNIPGVPGIGEKGARELIERFGSVERCLEHAQEISRKAYRENLLRYQEQARMSRDLARIRLDVPIDWRPSTFRRRETSREGALSLFRELGFRRFVEEVGGGERAGSGEERAGSGPAENCEIVLDLSRLQDRVAESSSVGRLALVPVLSPPEPMVARMVGLALACRPEAPLYVPVGHHLLEPSAGIREEELITVLRPVWADPRVRKIAEDLKLLSVFLHRQEVILDGLDLDTTVAAYLLDPERRDYSLPSLAQAHLGWDAASVTPPRRSGRVPDPAGCSFEVVAREAGWKCQALLALDEPLARSLGEMGLDRLYREVEMPLLSILAQMEWTGVRIDVPFLGTLAVQWKRDLQALERKIHDLAGEEFNIQSPRQLRHVLFDKLRLRPGRKTERERSFSTGMDVLEELSRDHPLPAALLEYRGLSKLQSTYVEALPRLVNPATGRVHASFNQAAAATGRLSSSNPNLQNIPVRSERGRQIRRAFIAEEGWRVLTADYSQIELRVLAHLARDNEMIRAFQSGEDIHVRTACQIFGVTPERVTSQLRRQAKAINFGIIYGMGAFRLAKELGVPGVAAQRFIDEYFQRFAGVKRYIDEVVARAQEEGRVSTLLGRVRPVPEIRSRNANLKRQGIRVAVNTTIQGTAADLIKMAMVELDRGLKREKLRSRLLIQVHDELLLEVPEGEVQVAAELVRNAMERCYSLEVPLVADVRSGPNWLEAD